MVRAPLLPLPPLSVRRGANLIIPIDSSGRMLDLRSSLVLFVVSAFIPLDERGKSGSRDCLESLWPKIAVTRTLFHCSDLNLEFIYIVCIDEFSRDISNLFRILKTFFLILFVCTR